MAEVEDVQQKYVKAEVSKVVRNEIMKAVIRRTIIEYEAVLLGFKS